MVKMIKGAKKSACSQYYDKKKTCTPRQTTPTCPPPPPGPKKPSRMGCVFSLIKTGIIFGAGLYTGVYVAQNYKIEKVEDPKVLFEKAQTYVKSKVAEFSETKKGDK